MVKKELVLVCGISGAGKTVTMNYFDKSGFYCIDNLPITALSSTVKALKDEESYERFAIAINSNVTSQEILDALTKVKSYEWINLKILFLDVSDEELLKRFQLTRKQHPFQNRAESLSDAIRIERKLLRNLRQHANVIIDTTNYTTKKLNSVLSKSFEFDVLPEFRVSFVSFGYKHGLPQDLDFAFDVRFIKNPYYIMELRELTGNNKEVYNYVMEQNTTQAFLKQIIPFLEFCLAEHKESGRSYISVGIGCTGGQHRSVAICNYLADYFKDKYVVVKDHTYVTQG